jgi:hypothetical protein
MPAIADFVDKSESEGLPEVEVQTDQAEDQAPTGGGGFNMSLLTAKTGDGPIEAYLDHPLNFNGSKPVAQMLRCFTGLFGALDYALVDIGMGALNFMRGRKPAAPASPFPGAGPVH